MDLNSRVQKIINYSELSSSEFADEIGVQRSNISHVLSGRNKPSLDFLMKIKDRFPEIQWEWLIEGKGTMVFSENEAASTPSSYSLEESKINDDEPIITGLFSIPSQEIDENTKQEKEKSETSEPIQQYSNIVEKAPEILILGAGHVSRCVADQFLFIGCGVTVVDDRKEYLKPEFFDLRVQRMHLDFKELQERLPLDSYTGIVVVTRAHEFDSVCLHQVRHVLPTYVGVMGSHKRIHHAFEVLRQEGWTDMEVNQLYGPIGLDIGAQTPEEIALSIVSEYVAVERHRKGQFLSAKRYQDEV